MPRLPLIALALLAACAGHDLRPVPDTRVERMAPAAGDGGVPRRVARIVAPAGDTIVAAAVAPDGRRFAYSLKSGGKTGVWIVGLETGATRPLLEPTRDRVDLAWSPDGARLAYWSGEGSALWTVEVETGRERAVWRGDDMRFASTPTWLPDGRLAFTRNDAETMQVGSLDERWVVETGGRAHRADLGIGAGARFAMRSGGEAAYFSWRCCGGASGALSARTPSGANRCLAGPLTPADLDPVWSRGGATVYFVATPGRAAAGDVYALYAASAAGGGARRVAAPPGGILALGADSAGDLIVVSGQRGAGAFEVWRYPAASLARATEPAGEIPGCPEPDARVRRFIAQQGLPQVRSVTELVRDTVHDVVVFGVTFGAEEDFGVYSGGTGIVAGGRTGWLGMDRYQRGTEDTAPAARFVPAATDRYLFTHEFAARMRRVGLEDPWLDVLAASPHTPYALLASLADSAPPERTWRMLGLLAARPEFGRDLPRMLRYTRTAARPGENPAANLAGRALWNAAPRVAADPATPEPALYLLAQMIEAHRGDAAAARVGAALLGNPVARRSPRVMLPIARDLPAADASARAAARILFRDPASPDSLLGNVAKKFGSDPALAGEMIESAPVRASGAALAWLMSQPVREDVRRRARELVLANPRVSEAGLAAVASSVEPDDFATRERLLSHPGTRAGFRAAAILLRRFSMFSTMRTSPGNARLNARARALLERRVADPALSESELMDIASEVASTDNTTVHLRMLENPGVRRCDGILERFVMVQRTYGDPSSKPVPSPESVQRRAEALLQALRAEPGYRPCHPDGTVTMDRW